MGSESDKAAERLAPGPASFTSVTSGGFNTVDLSAYVGQWLLFQATGDKVHTRFGANDASATGVTTNDCFVAKDGGQEWQINANRTTLKTKSASAAAVLRWSSTSE